MVFDRKVEIDELAELDAKQHEDVTNVLELEESQRVPDVLAAIDHAPPQPVDTEDRQAEPAWMKSLELADHYTEDTIAEELVERVHDLMADDVEALVHAHVVAAATDDDPRFADGMLADFFVDTGSAVGTNDDPVDDLFVVASARRRFLDDVADPLFNGGGSGGGPPAPPRPPADVPPAPPLGEPPPAKPTPVPGQPAATGPAAGKSARVRSRRKDRT